MRGAGPERGGPAVTAVEAMVRTLKGGGAGWLVKQGDRASRDTSDVSATFGPFGRSPIGRGSVGCAAARSIPEGGM